MAKHTPGPWTHDDGRDHRTFRIESADGYNIIAETHPYVRDGDTEANARLISACPEMLEALRRMVELETESVEYEPLNHMDHDGASCALCAAVAAIAKAEGRDV